MIRQVIVALVFIATHSRLSKWSVRPTTCTRTGKRLVFRLATIVIVLYVTRSIQAATTVFNDRALFVVAVPAGLTEGFETFPTEFVLVADQDKQLHWSRICSQSKRPQQGVGPLSCAQGPLVLMTLIQLMVPMH